MYLTTSMKLPRMICRRWSSIYESKCKPSPVISIFTSLGKECLLFVYCVLVWLACRYADENAPLMTSSMRQARLEDSAAKYDSAVIRFHFPDKLVLQAKFKPRETGLSRTCTGIQLITSLRRPYIILLMRARLFLQCTHSRSSLKVIWKIRRNRSISVSILWSTKIVCIWELHSLFCWSIGCQIWLVIARDISHKVCW